MNNSANFSQQERKRNLKNTKKKKKLTPAGQSGSTIIVLYGCLMGIKYKSVGQKDVNILTSFQCICEVPNNILVAIMTI